MNREQLDQQMRAVLAAIETCSHAPAAPPATSSAGSEHPSRNLVGGDTGAEPFKRAYGAPFHICEPRCRHRVAMTDAQRENVVREAQLELRTLKGHIKIQRGPGETEQQKVQRMLREARGWSPEQIAQSDYRMPARSVRRHRAAAGRDEETGHELERHDLPAEERQRQARALDEQGFSLSYIARKLNVSRSTIERDLGKRAA